MARDDFAVFILSHGRANNVITVKTLRDSGYTGKIYIIIDDQDKQADQYRERYGENVIQFCKEEEAKHSDVMDADNDMRIVLYARNKCHDIAFDLGLTYFLELDDDYIGFEYRFAKGGKLKGYRLKNFDEVCDWMIDFLEKSGALTVAFAQGGDFLGGVESSVYRNKLTRKAMNSFFCKTDRPFKFLGRINEDVNAYTLLGSRGGLFFTVGEIMLDQVQTQKNEHGLTDVYLKYGTYVKSFYSVMCMPSAITVSLMGASHKRMHHKVAWDRCVPQIISEKWSKNYGKTIATRTSE